MDNQKEIQFPTTSNETQSSEEAKKQIGLSERNSQLESENSQLRNKIKDNETRFNIIKYALMWCFLLLIVGFCLIILDMWIFKLNSHALTVLTTTVSAILSALIAAVIGSSIDSK